MLLLFGKHPAWLTVLWMLVAGCGPGNKQQAQIDIGATIRSELKPLYAKGFGVQYYDGYKIIEVNQPWKGSEATYRYVIKDPQTVYEGTLHNTTVIDRPIDRAALFSTTYISVFEHLGSLSKIAGVANASLIYSDSVRAMIEDGSIHDLGNDYDLDYERLVELQPGIIFIYALGNEFAEKMAKLETLGLRVALNAEYLEESPLGQAEWIKFVAAFLDKEQEAETYFEEVAGEYERLSRLAQGRDRPTVLCNLPWKGTWYVPGGSSFTSRLITDAGGVYPWSETDSRGSLNLDFEVVYDRAFDADVWINPGNAVNLASIEAMDAKHAGFRAFRSGRVYNHYNRTTEKGGNDYFESGTIRPHLVLKDLMIIFHPELFPRDSLYYYIKLS